MKNKYLIQLTEGTKEGYVRTRKLEKILAKYESIRLPDHQTQKFFGGEQVVATTFFLVDFKDDDPRTITTAKRKILEQGLATKVYKLDEKFAIDNYGEWD